MLQDGRQAWRRQNQHRQQRYSDAKHNKPQFTYSHSIVSWCSHVARFSRKIISSYFLHRKKDKNANESCMFCAHLKNDRSYRRTTNELRLQSFYLHWIQSVCSFSFCLVWYSIAVLAMQYKLFYVFSEEKRNELLFCLCRCSLLATYLYVYQSNMECLNCCYRCKNIKNAYKRTTQKRNNTMKKVHSLYTQTFSMKLAHT